MDISRIEIGSDCEVGMIRNEYTYDANHRIIDQFNILFDPDRKENIYSTDYAYDLAGNILTLNRRGLKEIVGQTPIYAQIDQLDYNYNPNNSLLQSVDDLITDPVAQPKGFLPDFSSYTYDANGNLITDGGKNLVIDYNILNLPQKITGTNSNTSLQLHLRR